MGDLECSQVVYVVRSAKTKTCALSTESENIYERHKAMKIILKSGPTKREGEMERPSVPIQTPQLEIGKKECGTRNGQHATCRHRCSISGTNYAVNRRLQSLTDKIHTFFTPKILAIAKTVVINS